MARWLTLSVEFGSEMKLNQGFCVKRSEETRWGYKRVLNSKREGGWK